MSFYQPELVTCIKSLKEIDFELAYLAILTHRGLKPLSRWEKPLTDRALGLLNKMDLLTEQVRRTVKTGKELTETIFSRSPAFIELYKRRFDNTPIDKSPPTLRFEGFLFGYPPCCIECYIRRPYAPNNLPEQDRRVLFHWPCPDCRITPTLLGPYRAVYELLDSY